MQVQLPMEGDMLSASHSGRLGLGRRADLYPSVACTECE